MLGTFRDATTIAACPACKSPLEIGDRRCVCTGPSCGRAFPVVRGIPVLIADERSVFKIDDYKEQGGGGLGYEPRRRLVSLIVRWIPSLTENRIGTRLYERLLSILGDSRPSNPKRILVVGAGDGGAGVQAMRQSPHVMVIETDVYFTASISAIADGHDLPFLNDSYDAVVFQAVLEHVADPYRCVDEAYRVLRMGGLIYAETPFMYPVHLGAYDFHRFSVTGHRRLFRRFEEIEVGVVAGPGTALALAMRSFFLSFSEGKAYQAAVRVLLPFVLFWLKYVDRSLVHKMHARDYASTSFFLGRKIDRVRSDREIVAAYGS